MIHISTKYIDTIFIFLALKKNTNKVITLSIRICAENQIKYKQLDRRVRYKFLRFVAYSGMFRADHDCGSITDSVVLCPQLLELINFYTPTRSFRFTRSFLPIPLSMLTREFGPSKSHTIIQRALTAPVLISSTLASIAWKTSFTEFCKSCYTPVVVRTVSYVLHLVPLYINGDLHRLSLNKRTNKLFNTTDDTYKLAKIRKVDNNAMKNSTIVIQIEKSISSVHRSLRITSVALIRINWTWNDDDVPRK